MKTITLKKNVFLILFILLCSVTSVYADNDGLITQQITVKLDKAGTLLSKIGNSKKYRITNLKVIGDIYGDDVRLLHDMAWQDGNLSVLDLSEANIVDGGYYYYYDYYYYTSKNKIGKYFFCDCDKLSKVILPNSVTEICNCAFQNCKGLSSLELPSNLTIMGEAVFENCSNLTSLTLPSSLTTIGTLAFWCCSGLTSLTLPSSITTIEYGAFCDCI